MSIRREIDSQDVAMMVFQSEMADDMEMAKKLQDLLEFLSEAQLNHLAVQLFEEDGEISYEVKKKRKMGFGTDMK